MKSTLPKSPPINPHTVRGYWPALLISSLLDPPGVSVGNGVHPTPTSSTPVARGPSHGMAATWSRTMTRSSRAQSTSIDVIIVESHRDEKLN